MPFLMGRDDSQDFSICEKLLASVEAYINEHYVEEKEEDFPFKELCCKSSMQDYEESVGYDSKSEKLQGDKAVLLESAPIAGAIGVPNRNLESAMLHLDETFSQMLLRLIDEKGFKDSVVYKKANVDRRHFSKIRNNKEYTPTKKTVVAFIIALELSMDEAIDLMKKAGFAFSNSSKFDVIIRFFIENKNYDMYQINEVLFKYGQSILGE